MDAKLATDTMRWISKSRVFRTLSMMPFASLLHFAMQRYLTKEWPRSADDLEAYAKRAETFIALFRRYSSLEIDALSFIEIGAGRDLALALALRCIGVRHIICLDIERLGDLKLINHAAEYMGRRWNIKTTKIRHWADLESLGIQYIAPARLKDLKLGPGSVACFFSTEVMEHIEMHSLLETIHDSHRLLHRDGLSVHAIDFSDHYARSDQSISRFNFLTLSDAEWKPHNSRYHYVNRLRHSEYSNIFCAAGFQIISDEVFRQEVPSEILGGLADRFRAMSYADISALRTILVARKRAEGKAAEATNVEGG